MGLINPEISLLAACVLLAVILSFGAFAFSVWNFIELTAQKRSTHTVLPVGNDSALQKLEKSIEELTGGGQGDLKRDLFEAGLDVDDLV